MLYIGCHLSSSKGFLAMGKQAYEIGANTFQFFTRNPRGGAAKPIDEADVKAYLEFAEEHKFGKIVAHAPYTLNACGKEERVRDFALATFKDDLQRMEYIPGNYYNFHPGSHVGQGAEKGIDMIAEILNQVLWEDMQTTVLLETMAGKGSEIGRSFEELRAIIDKTELDSKLGVCLDTCHISDGGYDIINNADEVIKQFDAVVGLDRLKAIHLNDSMNPVGAHKDRHAKIGEGHIGFEALMSFIKRPEFEGLPINLETPNDIQGYAKEIEMIKEAY
ncbi:MAG: deoxyribonuclease IV [Clostridiales bacterium]|nr:deoxyribonuclease IV [Clostridiales bacterium]